MSGPSAVFGTRRLTPLVQKSSHVAMTHDASFVRAPLPSAASGRVDAIVVPASRGASELDGAAYLSARLRVPLVALCSKNTRGADAAARLARVRGCRAIVVDVPSGYRYRLLPTRTAVLRFQVASANRQSDLSLKRNLGLLIARLHGWGKIVFLDDDIGDRVRGRAVGIPRETVRRLAAELDVRQIAGLAPCEFPDNSVVCHARRLAGYRQDTFVSGAALGVNCNDQPVPFFPDLYNEDWFFFSPLVAERNLGFVGTARQAAYDPYENPSRAREEEFGDLLAEGLFTLFEEQPAEMNYFRRLDEADEPYWERFIEARRVTLNLTRSSLESAIEYGHGDVDRYAAAIRSLDAAAAQLYRLTPYLCADYIDAWRSDLRDWEHATQRIRSFGETVRVLDELGLESRRLVGYDSGRAVRRHRNFLTIRRSFTATPSRSFSDDCARSSISSNPSLS